MNGAHFQLSGIRFSGFKSVLAFWMGVSFLLGSISPGFAENRENTTLGASIGKTEVSQSVTVAPFKSPDAMPLAKKRSRSTLNKLYQFDKQPLGSRIPVILMPGRAEEFQAASWWERFRKLSYQHPGFEDKFKLYAFIYKSSDELDRQAQDFVTEFKAYFGQLPPEQKALLVSYSLGGVISRDALEDPQVNEQVHSLIAMGVPFHGTPIFDPDWFTQYLGSHSPIRTVWDRAVYRIYLLDKNNLSRGIKWNNFDNSLPQFKLEPILNGDQVLAKSQPYVERTTTEAFKKKTIVYGSYLENAYLEQPPHGGSLVKKTTKIPKAIIGALIPLYGSSVHAVFVYMNKQMAELPTFSETQLKGVDEKVYRYNDGVIPLSSALFLPARTTPYKEDWQGMLKAMDCQQARVFVNIDHMHLGDYNIVKNKTQAVDLAHPDQGKRTPTDWILYDLEKMYANLKASQANGIQTGDNEADGIEAGNIETGLK